MEGMTTGDGANLGARDRHRRELGHSRWIWTGFALSIAATAIVGFMGYLHAKGPMALAIAGGSIASLLFLAFAGVFIYRMLQALRKSLEELAGSQARLTEHNQFGAARFRTLLAASPEAMIISNPGGEIIIMNSRAEQLFGYQREELLGKQIEVLRPPERFRESAPGPSRGLLRQAGKSADRHSPRSRWAAQGWDRVPDRGQPVPGRDRPGHPGLERHRRHHGAQGRGARVSRSGGKHSRGRMRSSNSSAPSPRASAGASDAARLFCRRCVEQGHLRLRRNWSRRSRRCAGHHGRERRDVRGGRRGRCHDSLEHALAPKN